ncbi:MAG: hypothetical protein FWH08_00125 [Oscillospiraceae bacterium]|nr:hypothetical protein [Oscillospiraceae bacterium]
MLIPNRTSAAYDFALFETNTKEKEKEAEAEIKIKVGSHSAAKSGSILKVLLAAVCAVALPIYFLSSKVQLSELSGKISDGLILLEQAQSENLRLQSELDNIVTLARVEEYAKNELGMQKIMTAQGKHISLDTGKTTEIAEIADDAATSISNWFSGVLEYLGF